MVELALLGEAEPLLVESLSTFDLELDSVVVSLETREFMMRFVVV